MKSLPHRFKKRTLVVDLYVFYKLHKNLGIGFRMKLAAMFLKSILEEFVIFYRAVVYEREISILTVMRVCIAIRRLAMRCPSGMCYSHRGVCILVIAYCLKILHLTFGFEYIQFSARSHQRDSRAVISSVF